MLCGFDLEKIVVAREQRVPCCHASWDDIEDSCQRTWPVWSSQRYQSPITIGNGGGSLKGGMWPTPDQASDVLWSIVQTEQAYRHPPFLYTRPLVKGMVESLQLNMHITDSLQLSLVPRTMLSIACAGGHLVWEEEMDALCAMMPRIEFQSLRMIEDYTRALKMSRHKTGRMDVLDKASHDVMKMTGSLDLAALIAQGIVYQRHVPRYLFQSITHHLKSNGDNDASLKALGTLGTAMAHADCLNRGESREISILTDMLMDRIDNASKTSAIPPYHLHRLHPFLVWVYSAQGTQPKLLQESIAAREDMCIRRPHTISTFQREVYDVLTSYMGLSCVMEQTLSGISVDIAIPAKCVALEINGPSHFYRNVDSSTVMLPNNDFKEMIVPVVQPGWRLVHVQQNVWDTLLHDRKDKAEYLQSLVHHGATS